MHMMPLKFTSTTSVVDSLKNKVHAHYEQKSEQLRCWVSAFLIDLYNILKMVF